MYIRYNFVKFVDMRFIQSVLGIAQVYIILSTMTLLKRSIPLIHRFNVINRQSPVRFISATQPQLDLKTLFSRYPRYVPDDKIEECPPDYKECPERDIVNYPRPKYYLFSPKVRLGFIPDAWFNFFYNKTGVTGELFNFILKEALNILTNNYYYFRAVCAGCWFYKLSFQQRVVRRFIGNELSHDFHFGQHDYCQIFGSHGMIHTYFTN